jgi:hypothetical protein
LKGMSVCGFNEIKLRPLNAFILFIHEYIRSHHLTESKSRLSGRPQQTSRRGLHCVVCVKSFKMGLLVSLRVACLERIHEADGQYAYVYLRGTAVMNKLLNSNYITDSISLLWKTLSPSPTNSQPVSTFGFADRNERIEGINLCFSSVDSVHLSMAVSSVERHTSLICRSFTRWIYKT